MDDVINVEKPAHSEDRPETIQEAVNLIIAGMSEKDKSFVQSKEKDGLGIYHLTWGMSIRNACRLWDNKPLLDSCARSAGHEDGLFFMPDQASGIIMGAVWDRLQDTVPSE